MQPLYFSSIKSQITLLLKYCMFSQAIPSRKYSSCSDFSVSWMNNCCSFSLQKLMQNCSKLYQNDKRVIIINYFHGKDFHIPQINKLSIKDTNEVYKY